MGQRRQARELALQALFFLDVNPGPLKGGGSQEGIQAFCEQRPEEVTDSIKPFFLELVQGVLDDIEHIDGLLNKFSTNWKLSRMSLVDRNIMRMATFELLKCTDIPPSVSINEAVEIGKKFGTRDSGPFINGILDKIRSESE